MVRTRSGEAEGATGTQPDDACLCKALEALHHGTAVHLLGARSLVSFLVAAEAIMSAVANGKLVMVGEGELDAGT